MNSISTISPNLDALPSTKLDHVTSARASDDGFWSVMAGALGDAAKAVQSAEATSTQALQGQASIQNVVESVMKAERQLQTVLAIRDKVVAAYQEISRINI